MIKRLFVETLIVATGTLFFIALAATVGISRSEKETPLAMAAEEVEQPPCSARPDQPYLEPPDPFARVWER